MGTWTVLLFIAGERNIFCLTESGQLRYMKKFEYDVSCFTPYNSSKYISPMLHEISLFNAKVQTQYIKSVGFWETTTWILVVL